MLFFNLFLIGGFPHSSVGKESACNGGDPGLIPGLGKIPWRRDRLPTPVLLGFPCGSAGKESTGNVRDLGSTPWLGRSPGEGIGYPLQCCFASLVAQLVKNPPAMRENWVPSLGWEDPLEKGKNPLQYSCLDNPHEPRSLVDCSPSGRKGSDTTEQLSIMHNTYIICVCVRVCAVLSPSGMSNSLQPHGL